MRLDFRAPVWAYILVVGVSVVGFVHLERNQSSIFGEQQDARERGYDARVAPCLVLLLPPNDDPNPRTLIARHPPRTCLVEPVLQRLNEVMVDAGLPPSGFEPVSPPSHDQ